MNNFKFCLFTGIIDAILGTKFQVNQLTITLFFEPGSKSPPSPVAGEISKCRRLRGSGLSEWRHFDNVIVNNLSVMIVMSTRFGSYMQ